MFSLFLIYFPEKSIIQALNTRAETILNRKILVDDFNYSFRGVKLSNVRIIEPDGTTSYLGAQNVEMTFSLAPILKRKLVLQDIYIQNLNLEIAYDKGEYSIGKIINALLSSDKEEAAAEEEKEEGPSFRTVFPTIHLNNSTIQVTRTEAGLAPLQGNYTFDGKIIYSKENGIDIREMMLVLPETRGTIGGGLNIKVGDDNFHIIGGLNLDKVDIRWVYLFGGENPPKLPYYLVSGQINNLDINKDYTEGTIGGLRGTLTNGTIINIKSGYCRVPYTPRTLILRDIVASANRSNFELNNLEVVFGKSTTFEATMDNTNILDVIIMIPPIEKSPLEGIYTGKLSYVKKRYNGTLTVENGAFPPYIEDVNTTITASNSIFSVENVKATVLDNPATISIASTKSTLDSFALNLTFDTLKINQSETTLPILDSSFKVNGIIKANTISSSNIELSDSYIGYRISPGELSIDRFKTLFQNATITGEGRIKKKGQTMRGNVISNFSNLQVQTLSTFLPKIKNRFYGLASGNLSLQFHTKGKQPVFDTGNLDVKIAKGKLQDTGIQNGLGIVLEPLQYKLKDLEFENIYGNVAINNDRYEIHSLMFDSPNIKLSLNGNINRKNVGSMDITLLFTNQFIEDIPNFAYPQFQKYKKGDWYMIPFEIRNQNILDGSSISITN